MFQIYGVDVPRKFVESKHFYPHAPPQSKLSPKFLSSTPTPGNEHYSFPQGSVFFGNFFPQLKNRMEETMICFIKNQSKSMRMTWNIIY